jgi:hypothetical protein
MNSIAIRLIVFACVFGGALFGMFLRGVLAEHQLSADSKDTVRIGMSLIGTLTALVLGLLIASAKSYYDTQSSELTEMSAKVVLLDRVLPTMDQRRRKTVICCGTQLPGCSKGFGRKTLGNIRKCYLRQPGAKLSMIKFRNYRPRTTLSVRSKPRH